MLTRPLTQPLTGPLVRGVGEGGGVSFSPLSLFAGGVAGAWYDPSDLSTLFSDSAGTTPAVVDGPVGKMLDKSGNGFHASQATSTARPTLKQDGGGRYYLLFDGVDDALLSASYAPTASGVQSAFVAAQVANITGNKSLIDSDQSGGVRISQTLRVSAATAQTIVLDATNSAKQSDGGTVTASTSFVLGMTTSTTSATGYLNGVAGTPIARVSPQSGTLGIAIGNRWSGGQPHSGAIYGAIQVAKLVSAAERDAITRLLASKSGVSL